MIKERLKNIISKLPDSCFSQIHRSFIINIDAIDSIKVDKNKVCIDGKEIGISKSYKSDLLTRINSIG
jgi:DNA-binding LytR/AlgR family response regulator